ncbi:hypothetical protein FS749_008344 [Ceratobasidium sp. UAMH 11750]|nr:hypothetical protein FS749_008344 [Ceratobasidium sp. UAMH 11750]
MSTDKWTKKNPSAAWYQDFDEKTVGDSKPVKENIEHEGKSVFTEATIAPVSQANSFGASNAPVPTLPPTPPVSEDSSQAESTPSTTCNVDSAEQQAHVSDEPQLQSRSLSTDSATVKETRVPTSLEDAPTASGTPAASCRSTNAPTNSNQSEAPVTTTLSGQSLKLTTPKRQKILKSPSRSTSSRVLRLYASNPRFQIKDAVRAAQLKKKKCASKKAKLSRRSKRPATAAVPPVVSTEPSVAAPVQPPPAAVSETPAPLSEGLGLAGTTAMEPQTHLSTR